MKKQHIEIDPFGGESEEDEIKRIQKVVDEAEKAKAKPKDETNESEDVWV